MGLLELSEQERLTKVRGILTEYNIPKDEIDETEQLIKEIRSLKKQKNAVILGHNYMTPDVFFGVSDYVGDSLELARIAAENEAPLMVFNGVHFMAETAKILSPNKKVLIGDLEAGCSLAESLKGEDVIQLKEQYPGVPIVSYINCGADVKAEVDVICTSANAVKVVNSMEGDTVILVPDSYLAGNVAKQTDKKIIAWKGKCMVHELYSVVDVELTRRYYPEAKIVAHPECKDDVTALADYTGSTSQMGTYIKENNPKQVLLLTECSMTENLKDNYPETEFISMCQSCPFMKKITLRKVRDTLRDETNEIFVPEPIRIRAKKSLDRMLAIGR